MNCDRTRIGQLLSNLLGNALTHGKSDKPVIIHAATRDGFFELWVANAGEPIPHLRSRNCSSRSSAARFARAGKVLGLGLYIASQIAKAHGGELTVSSTPDETRFTFTMPLN